MRKHLFIIGLILAVKLCAYAQTVGLIQHSTQSFDDGYVLFAPMRSNSTYLIDKCGKEVKRWTSNYKPALSVYLLDDGNLLRTGNVGNPYFTDGGNGGRIEKMDLNGNVVWSYTVSDAGKCQHHDVKALPNGNVLVIAWESHTKAEAIANGRNSALVADTIWSEQILEIQPIGATGGNIVWEWHLWDHMVQEFDNTKPNYAAVASNPQLINLNYTATATQHDWIHLNSIDYNPSLDQILISSHTFCEIWIIDHSTTSVQAASHMGGNAAMGGDIIYRWGNPLAYNNGTLANKKFFGQHNAHWIKDGLPNAGHIMIFNNGLNRTGGTNYSTAEIIIPPLNGYNYSPTLPYLPTAATWIYNAGNTHNYYAQNISGAEQLQNGNVLLCNGPSGVFTEVDNTGNTVWQYINPVTATGALPQNSAPTQNLSFRCSFYPYNFAGFATQTLVSGNTIENSNATSATCSTNTGIEYESKNSSYTILPNPATQKLNIISNKLGSYHTSIEMRNIVGELLYKTETNINLYNFEIDVEHYPSGIYFMTIVNAQEGFTQKVVIQH
jgi:Arylsulfotransferase (ASST)/Secretion system C-terminal sorting domain